jgi:hypothetical protein
MALTDSLVVMAQYLHDLIAANQVTLGVQDVFYGDQVKIPRTPTVCVESDLKNRTLSGTARKVDLTMTCFILIYGSAVAEVQSKRKAVDVLAESIEGLIHANSTLGGNFIHSFIPTMQSGLANKSGTQFRSSRLTVQALSQTLLPPAH